MVIVPFQQALNSLLSKRIIRLGGEVNDDISNSIVAQLLYLDQKDPEEDITLYINSPGGSVTAGMAVFDTMRHVRPVIYLTKYHFNGYSTHTFRSTYKLNIRNRALLFNVRRLN